MEVFFPNPNNKCGYSHYKLTNVIGTGGEGTVYAVPRNPHLCIKILKKASPKKQRKIELMCMIRRTLQFTIDPSRNPFEPVAWPTYPVYEDKNMTRLCGFVMYMITSPNGKAPLPLERFYYKQEDRPGNVSWRYMIRVAMNISWVINELHKRNIVLGDINSMNTLITSEGYAAFIDADSYQIVTRQELFTCDVYRPDYLAPEFVGKSVRNVKRTFEGTRGR